MSWFSLLAAYGICFGIQNKVPWLRSIHPFIESMVKCTYCLGTHCGWIMWLLTWAATGHQPSVISDGLDPDGVMAIVFTIYVWSMVSATFCYALDAIVQWFETRSV